MIIWEISNDTRWSGAIVYRIYHCVKEKKVFHLVLLASQFAHHIQAVLLHTYMALNKFMLEQIIPKTDNMSEIVLKTKIDFW
jgi:hypothetical protein